MPTMDYLTTPQVAARIGKSIRSVQRLVASGDLRYVQKLPGPNGAYLFAPEEVDRLLPPARVAS